MTRLARLVLAGAVAGVATFAVPGASAAERIECVQEPCYECVMYPCYPGDWVDFLTGGKVTVEQQDMVVCVTEPCYQPMPVVVCAYPTADSAPVCTPRDWPLQ